MDSREEHYLLDRLIPVPKEIKFKDGKEYLVRDRCKVVVNASETEGIAAKTEALFRNYWKVSPSVSVKADRKQARNPADAYAVRIEEKQLVISVKGMTGLMNALKTLRQLAEVERGTEKVSGYFLVPCEISDGPAMPFRGVHLCIFPETELWDIEKQLRIAAYHKFNYAVIEPWGIFPFESRPEFCFRDRRINRQDLRRLIDLGKELGITLFPQLNILGHASGARCAIGKHAILDAHPELQPIFEPDGWAWCLTNPHTRRILTDMVVELHEFFGNPAYFHIGCDEADHLATCRDCRRKNLESLLLDHLRYFHDLLAGRGARMLMWHDMLLTRGDERWKGYIVCGRPEQELGNLYKKLPKDIVICDWQYGYKEKAADAEPEWPTTKFFKKEGFDTLVCPWINTAGARSLGKLAGREKLMGMLETTWHLNHHRQFVCIYAHAAGAAWNPESSLTGDALPYLTMAQHLRQVLQDMETSQYERTGFNQLQVNAGWLPYQDA
ncbi:MAG: Glycosyl hydrolase family 20, catalytic domain [Lentisphaerae bacterium ADurb.Bin242]|nr:MAG: Glycosyl hydrolase family 20, catalytic domain [Lentisphaerae bacterium ADurb.Bin242]